jgi:hypothetical protein
MDEFARWFKDKGDINYKLNYPLNSDSIVFDVGGYRGGFAQEIHERYGCNVYVFEPYFKIQNTDKIRVFKIGFSNTTRIEKIYPNGDATSLHGKGDGVDIQLICFYDWIMATNITPIDLISINIEGEEYTLLKHMIDKNITGMFDNIQIQFHNFVPDCEQMRNEIIGELSKTHTQQWCYEFVWESWKLNNI